MLVVMSRQSINLKLSYLCSFCCDLLWQKCGWCAHVSPVSW